MLGQSQAGGGTPRALRCLPSILPLLMPSTFRLFWPLFLWLSLGPLHAAEAAVDLPALVAEQQALLARAEAATAPAEIEDLRPALQGLVSRYEDLLETAPNSVPVLTSYALLLGNPLVDEPQAAIAHLLRADRLDRAVPLVKNQLGKLLAEQGKPAEALAYFLAARDLAPLEPLYQLQIGLLLSEARDTFLAEGRLSRAQLDASMLEAFSAAATLAPARMDYGYRAAEAYYDLETPRWDDALHVWESLEPLAKSELERQTLRLHQAHVQVLRGEHHLASVLLAAVTEPTLTSQRAKVEMLIAAPPPALPRAP
jgi:tetratricopeptide (TPR) repeat protein